MRRLSRGMTLIEVVGGLALLAAVLGGELAIKARCTRQARITDERRRAIEAADVLLSLWWQQTDTFPRAGAGSVSGSPEFEWRTRTVPNVAAQRLGAQVVRLEVLKAGAAPGSESLAAVDVVLPAGGGNR